MQFHPLSIKSISRIDINTFFGVPTQGNCILFFSNGEGLISSNQISREFNPGSFFFVSKMMNVRLQHGTEVPKIHIVEIDFSNILFIESLRDRIIQLPKNNIMENIFRNHASLSAQEMESLQLSIESVLYSFVSPSTIPHDILADTETERIQLALDSFIESHINEGFSADQLSSSISYTTRRLNSLLMQQFGLTTTGYTNHYKLSKAKKMLIFSDKNITEIAFACGFKSIHYFSRVFKQIEGVSPQEYRLNITSKSQN